MQSLTTSITRSFHWGIAIVMDHDADIPDMDPERPVTAGESALIVTVRHGADIRSSQSEPAEVSIVVRRHERPVELAGRRQLFDGVLATPTGRLSIGDAIEDVELSTHAGHTRVTVSVDAEWPVDDHHHESLVIDLAPAERS